MNWIVFLLLAWVTMGLELGLRAAFQLGTLQVAPSFAMIVVVYIALWARPRELIAAALLIGVMLDLSYQHPTATGETVSLVGPWALGCALAAYTVLNFRALVFRKNPLSIAFLCAVGAGIASILVAAILALRAFYDDIVLVSAGADLWQRLGSALYTGVVALAVGPLLQMLEPWLGFRRRGAAHGAPRWH